MRDQLLGYLLDALDDQERDRLEEELRRNPALQRDLELLHSSFEPLRYDEAGFDPPAGLAEKTLSLVARELSKERSKGHSLGPATLPMAAPSRWSFADLATAAGVFFAAATLLFPAISQSRDNARLAGCQNNLRQLGVALTQFSGRHGGLLPSIPDSGPLAAAGVTAVELKDGQYIDDDSVVVCPGSSLAQREEPFRIPTRQAVLETNPDDLHEVQRTMGGSMGFNLGTMQRGEYRPVKNQHRTTFALMADAPCVYQENRRSNNHGGCAINVLYEDGHVASQSNCVSEQDPRQDHIYLNDDGLIAAGTHLHDSVIGHSAATPIPNVLDRK